MQNRHQGLIVYHFSGLVSSFVMVMRRSDGYVTVFHQKKSGDPKKLLLCALIFFGSVGLCKIPLDKTNNAYKHKCEKGQALSI